MTPLQGTPIPDPPRLFEFWPLVRARLDSETMRNVLAPDVPAPKPSRVRLATDWFPAEEGNESRPWGRVVVLPINAAWAAEERAGHDVLVPFLVRTDYHRPEQANFDITRWMEASQAEAYALLHGWIPDDAELDEMAVRQAVNRVTPPQPQPLWDTERGLWIMSSVYHVLAERT